MFLLGHLGIGERLGRPFIRKIDRAALTPYLFLGCVLPDLIDKPLYYLLSFATGKHADELGLVSSTRTFGHSLLFALLVWAIVRGRRGFALFVGMLTHLALDLGGDLWGKGLALLRLSSQEVAYANGPSTWAAVLFPLLGFHFPIAPFHSLAEHAMTFKASYVVFGELLGAALLVLDWREHLKVEEIEDKEFPEK